MLEELGKDLANEFEDVEFIGMFYSEKFSLCTFNCNRTGATFCGNSFDEIQNKIKYIRENFSPLKHKA